MMRESISSDIPLMIQMISVVTKRAGEASIPEVGVQTKGE